MEEDEEKEGENQNRKDEGKNKGRGIISAENTNFSSKREIQNEKFKMLDAFF